MAQFIDPQYLLTPQELTILQEADACPYQVSYASKLEDIHDRVPVYILERKTGSRLRKVVVEEDELKKLQEQARIELDELYRKQRNDTLTEKERQYFSYYERVLSAQPGEHNVNIPETLGEFIYDAEGKRVNLYIYTIRDESRHHNTPATWLLAQTYAHEMHHAVYHTLPSIGAVNTYVEEPMAELGMLRWAKAFENKYQQYHGFHMKANRDVEWRKYGLQPDYGFGEYVYRRGWIMPQMLVDAGKPLMNNPLIQKYSLPFRIGAYPWPHEKRYEYWLWLILHNQTTILRPRISSSADADTPTECNPEAIDEGLDVPSDSFVNIYENPKITFCDPFYMSDDFVKAVEKKLMEGLEYLIPNEDDRRQHIRENMIFRRKDSVDVYELIKDVPKGILAKKYSYFQSLDGNHTPSEPFHVVMGIPPFYKTIKGKQVEVWQDAVMAGYSLQRGGSGIFCTPADWYYYGNARERNKRKYEWLISQLDTLYDFEDSQDLLPLYPRLSKGACIIGLKDHHGEDIQIVASYGSSYSHPRYTFAEEGIIFRDVMSFDIIMNCRQWPSLNSIMLWGARGAGTYTIHLSRTLKRVNGKFRMVSQTGMATKKNTNTITINNPANMYSPNSVLCHQLFGVQEPILNAFFESELATFIAMTYSGITKYSYPTVTKAALGFLPDIIYVINEYVRNNGPAILSQQWNDDTIYQLFGLTDPEIDYVRHRLKCN